MISDTLGDMLTRIRNAALVHKKTVAIPYSKLILTVLKVMTDANYLESVTVDESGTFKVLNVKLKYVNGVSAISHLKRISKPGVRIYTQIADFKHVLNGLGIAIISTSKGVMSDKAARKANLGGEVLAELW